MNTGLEMKEEFLLQYDINGSAAVAGFEDQEIYDFLMKAQLDLIDSVFRASGPEELQEVVDYESGILVVTGGGYDNPKAYLFDNGVTHLPTDFLYYVNSRSKMTRSGHPTKTDPFWVDSDEIKLSAVSNFLPDNSNRMIFYNPKATINSGNLTLIFDYFSTPYAVTTPDINVIMAYIREPSVINDALPSELNPKWHYKIIDLAVGIAEKVTNDVRTRVAPQKQ